MIKLELDTTTAKLAKVRITQGEKVICENLAESPLVSIKESLEKAHLNLSDIDEFTANPGPGSYTGIRVGAAVVNALNFALGKDATPVEPIYS